MEQGVLQGLAAFRWAAWLWMAVTLVISRHDLAHPWLAGGLVGMALALTVVDTSLLRARRAVLLAPPAVAAELALGAALVVCDGWAYRVHHAFSTSQSLGSVWPLAGVLTAGIALSPWAGAVAGATMGLCRWAAARANGVRSFDGHRVLSLSSGVVFYAVAGAVAGWVFVVMRRKEDEVSSARAREEVARTLHDGVLQTLALVERRAGDPQLARLAREQERELREFLFGSVRDRDAARDLGAALRDAAARYESRFAGRAQVVVAQDVPRLRADEVEALSGAVGEALTNAGKHGHASRVTVYVEPYEDGPDGKGPDGKGPDGKGPDGKGPDGDGRRTRWPDGRWKVFCSVKDDGSGFEVVASAEGVGLSRSIRGRLADAGGRAEVRSQPGTGTEVCLWL